MATSKANGPLIDPALCRCCRSIKKCRILTSEYLWMGEKEIYADMIMDCYGILLSHMDGARRERGVCATCVGRLRDARAFRLQLLQSERLFLDALADEEATDMELVSKEEREALNMKSEPKDLSDLESTGSDRGPSPLPLSEEEKPMGDLKPPKAEPPPPTAPAPAPLAAPDSNPEPSDDDAPLSRAAAAKAARRPRAKRKTKLKKEAVKPKVSRCPPEGRDNTDRDLDYMAEENLLTLIEYSHVCPFKNRRNNYYCYYCKDYYPKPEDLREHTETHSTKPFQLLMGYKKVPKLDITRIDCKLCPEKIDDVEAFKRHIFEVHGKNIYFEAPDKLLLYRLTWNNLKCVTCKGTFEDFNSLNTHMVEHFSNYTCHICGTCFLEKPRLDAHLKRHRDDDKHTCEICGKVFKSSHYKDMHIDIVHRKKAIIRCPKCDECFMSYALKNKHLSDAHGQKRVYPCNLCDKVYNRQKTLTEHQRRNHQKVLKHQCEYCDQRFYLPSRLKEHIATHTGERNFRCEYCDKSYPRQKSLQYHIRTHSSERRFRCHVCGQGFVQNASMKAHIKSHHPECEVEDCYY